MKIKTKIVVMFIFTVAMAMGTSQAGATKLASAESFAPLVASARASGYGERAPVLEAPSAFCRTAKTCRAYCDGTRVKVSMVEAAMAGKGLPALVDPAMAVQGELRSLGCSPAGGDPRTASANCGIRFLHRRGRGVQPSVVRGLARAALEAGARGYSILVGSTFRTAIKQMKKVCKRIAKGKKKVCGGTIACPGGSKHGMGFAIDVALSKNGGALTPITGSAKPCDIRIGEVRASKKLQKLMDVMFSAGWSWYCREPWHFEHSSARIKERRYSLAELGLTAKGDAGGRGAGGSAGLASKTWDAAKGAVGKVGSWVSDAVGGARDWVSNLAGETAYVNAKGVALRAGSSSKAHRVTKLRRCEKVRIVGRSSGWREVVTEGGRGHVYYRYLTSAKPSGCR